MSAILHTSHAFMFSQVCQKQSTAQHLCKLPAEKSGIAAHELKTALINVNCMALF